VKSFAKKLRQGLDHNKKNQSQLATEMGVSQAQVSRWLSGENKPRAADFPKLAGILGCRVDYLIDDASPITAFRDQLVGPESPAESGEDQFVPPHRGPGRPPKDAGRAPEELRPAAQAEIPADLAGVIRLLGHDEAMRRLILLPTRVNGDSSPEPKARSSG
jgi:transcriptional regulator with XRE-family HTH domain